MGTKGRSPLFTLQVCSLGPVHYRHTTFAIDASAFSSPHQVILNHHQETISNTKMQLSSIITLLFSLSAFTNAYSCAPGVLPADCLKQAAAFYEKMKAATFSIPKPEAAEIPDVPAAAAITPAPPAQPPKHQNCGTLAMMDANDAPCDRMYRPAAQPSPVPPPVPQVEAGKEVPAVVLKRMAIPLQA